MKKKQKKSEARTKAKKGQKQKLSSGWLVVSENVEVELCTCRTDGFCARIYVLDRNAPRAIACNAFNVIRLGIRQTRKIL